MNSKTTVVLSVTGVAIAGLALAGNLFFFGFAHVPLGQAVISHTHGGVIVISNIGSSGQDGVLFDTGLAQGFWIGFPSETCGQLADEETFTISPIGVANPAPRIGDDAAPSGAGGDSFFDVFFDPVLDVPTVSMLRGPLAPETPCVDARGYLAGELVSLSSCLDYGAPLGNWPRGTCHKSVEWSDFRGVGSGAGINFLKPVEFTPAGGETKLIDTLRLVPRVLAHGGSWQTEMVSLSLSGNFGVLTIDDEGMQKFGNRHTGLGEAHVRGRGGDLILSNIGATGDDGVEIELKPPVSEALVGLVPTGGTGGGETILVGVRGATTFVGRNGAPALLATAKLAANGESIVHSAEHPAGTDGPFRVRFYLEGSLVGEIQDQFNPLFESMVFPARIGFRSSGFPRRPAEFIEQYAKPGPILIGTSGPAGHGTVITADTITYTGLESPPVDSINSVEGTGANVAEMTIVSEETQALADSDGDGLADVFDNCTEDANPDQRDTDGDGYGNLCDPDLTNDGAINFPDLQGFEAAFFTMPGTAAWNENADLNGDNAVNFGDLLIVEAMFFLTPGPSGITGRRSSFTLE